MSKNSKKALVAAANTVSVENITDHDLAVLQSLEETPVNTANTQAVVQSEAGPIDETKDLDHLVAEVDDNTRLAMALKIGKGFDDRIAYENQKNPNNLSIQKNFGKQRDKLVFPSIAAIMVASQVEPDFVNRSVSEGSRYNIYAVDKLADIVKALRDGALSNKVNIAICKSLFAFRNAGESFTGEMAKAAVCDKIRVSREMQKILTRHTVSTGTMSTQASSTLTALQTMGIIENTGTFRAPVYKLTASPQTRRLEEVLMA